MATATDSRPNAPARAPASSSAKSRPNKTGSQGKFQFVNFDGLQNYLKLRTKLPITDQLSAEVGADYNVTRKDAAPQAALFYEVLRGDKHFGTFRLTLDRVAFRKPFDLQREKWGCRVNATAGAAFGGAPEIGFDVDNVRPAWALVIPAAILLLAGKPLSGSRSFGNLRAKLPLISDDAVARAEGMGRLHKRGKGLQVGVSQLNAVLRL